MSFEALQAKLSALDINSKAHGNILDLSEVASPASLTSGDTKASFGLDIVTLGGSRPRLSDSVH